MANIELRENLIGGGFSGTIAPALSWFDQQALQQSAQGSMASAVELRYLNVGMGRLVQTVVALESELGFRLEAQTRILDSQLDVLQRIEQALRRPGQVSAAERISNTGELLRRGRYARALNDAELAIGDDPNNPAGFSAAGWAAIGLGRGERARELFLEAADASDGDERDTALRQAARIAFALEDGTAALGILEKCAGTSAFQRWATEYDRVVYLVASGDHASACETLRRVLAADDRFAPMVLLDEVLNRELALCDVAQAVIQGLTDDLAKEQRGLLQDLETTEQSLASYTGPLTSEGQSSQEALQEAATRLRDESRAEQTGTSLRTRLDRLSKLRTRSIEIRKEATAWPTRAEEAYQTELAAAARHDEAERAAAAARRPADLENAARRFAAQRQATVSQKGDGSWVITKKRLLSERAWRARTVGDEISIEEVPWDNRQKWD